MSGLPSRIALAAGAGLLVLAALALWQGAETVLRAWYVAVVTWSAVPVGCLALLILNHMLGREVFLGRVLEAGCRALLPTAAGFLPVLILPGAVFPWTEAGFQPHSPLQEIWLGHAAFALRTAVYFSVWITVAELLIREERVVGLGHKRRGVAVAGALAYALTTSFAGVDWYMLLDPGYSSASYGFLISAHQVAAALGFAVLTDSLLVHRPEQEPVARSLLIGGALVWAFFAYMEYLTIWSANVPELARWYLERADALWVSLRWVVAGLLAAGIALALAAGLLPARLPVRLAALCILLSQVAEALWQLLPAMAAAGTTLLLVYALALLVAGAGLLAVFLAALAGRARAAPGTAA